MKHVAGELNEDTFQYEELDEKAVAKLNISSQ